MPRNSEMIQNILTSPEGQKVINFVSPIYDDARIALYMFQAIGLELDGMTKWANFLRYEMAPNTATWSLYLWESEYGIPTDTNLSIYQRRANILAMMKNRQPLNPVRLEKIISAVCGYDSKVIENTGPNQFDLVIFAENLEATVLNRVIDAANNRKPAHLIFRLEYAQVTSGTWYMGAVMIVYKDLIMGQVN